MKRNSYSRSIENVDIVCAVMICTDRASRASTLRWAAVEANESCDLLAIGFQCSSKLASYSVCANEPNESMRRPTWKGEMDLAAIWTGLGSCRSRGSSILRQAIFFISACQIPVFHFDYFYVMFMHSVILSGTNLSKGKLMYIISISLYRPQRF